MAFAGLGTVVGLLVGSFRSGSFFQTVKCETFLMRCVMKRAAYYSVGIVLLIWTGLNLGVTLQEDPTRTLIVDATDPNPIVLTIVDSGGDPAIPDVTVSGETYLDIATITGRPEPGDTIAVAIDAATTWDLTGLNSGTVTIQGYSGITFSAIDSLVGAAGEDTFVFLTNVAFGGALDGGPGAGNRLDYSARTTGVLVNLTAQTATGTNGITNIQNVIGGTGADTITGDSQDNTFTGGLGRDNITGGDGLDTIVETRNASFFLTDKKLTIGSEGDDDLTGIETAVLTGGDGANTLNASTFTLGPVVLDGAGGNDTLTGGSGNDVLTGGPGADTLNGRGGTDTVIEARNADFTLTDAGLVIGSEGTDTLELIENIYLIGGPGDNHFNLSALAGGSISVEGDAGYDTLTLEPQGVSVDLVTNSIIVPGFQSVNYGTVEAVIVDGDAVVPADATLNAREYYLDSLIVTNNSVLTLGSDVSATEFQGVKIATISDLTIDAGSHISADGQGYAAGQGPGAGSTAGLDVTYGGGGGYGGQGGNGDGGAQGGVTYGSAIEPTDLGSGGGNDGGPGGGAIWLVVDGTLFLDGGVVCQGAPGGYQTGGGSGGSIYLTAGTLAGAGTISADGGDGGEGGGGGGGGRIALYYGTDTFSGTTTASGGVGFEPGAVGTIYPWDVSAEDYLEESIVAIGELAVTDLTNAHSGNALINKIEATIALIEAGLYQDALMKLQNDLLRKMDGCVLTGKPDRNDWIITCEAQQKLYPLIWEAIQLLQSLTELMPG
jgi:hypothetical protein